MKKVFIICMLFVARNTFALYGAKVVPASQPYVVSLQYADNYFCSGVLISPTKVLTAGHCIEVMGTEVAGHSHGFVYGPENVEVKIGKEEIRAISVTLSPCYFEGNGLRAEDLALIELSKPTKTSPIALADKSELLPETPLFYYARNKMTEGKLNYAKSFDSTIALILDKASGACLGDSGGAIVLKKNGPPRLAGILMYRGGADCKVQSGYGHFPKVRFSEYY